MSVNDEDEIWENKFTRQEELEILDIFAFGEVENNAETLPVVKGEDNE